MKTPQMFFLSLATGVLLAACNPSPPPVVPPVVEQTAFDLGITVTGVPGAPVKVLNAAGEIKFDATVTGSKTLSALPKGKYTVTGGAVANFTAPATQTADLSAGNGTVTLGYTSAAGQALALDKIQGTLSDPLARGNKIGVFLANSVLTSVLVGSDGSVSLPLTTPPASELFPFLPPAGSNCTYTGTSSANTGKTFFASDLAVYSPQGDVIGAVIETPVGGSGTSTLIHVYADSAQTYKGTVKCVTPSSTFSYRIDVQMVAGWNALISDGTASSDFTFVTAPTGTRVQLNLDKLAASVDIVLATPSLTLTAGQSVTTNATIYQVGGLSGKIDLSTDVAGVSVEPASVTLPVLGTQSVRGQSLFDTLVLTSHGLRPLKVGAQRLITPLTFRATADVGGFGGTMNLLAKQNGQAVGQTAVGLSLVAPGVTAAIQYSQGITVERGQSVAVTIQAFAREGYKGDAQISLEGLPEGVTASSATVTFTGASFFETKDIQLTVVANSVAKTGLTSAQLVSNANGRVSRASVTVNVPMPVVNITYPGVYGSPPELKVYQGETANLPIALKSVYGFRGSVTLSLSALPTGVTSVPVTINMEPGVEARANFRISSSSEAGFGRFNIKVVGDSLAEDNSYGNTTTLQLYVSAKRTILPITANFYSPARGGFWSLSDFHYVNNTAYRTLSRIKNEQVISSQEIEFPSWVSGLVSTIGGDAILVSTDKLMTVKEDGTMISAYLTNGPSSGPFVVDAQDRVWLTQYDATSNSYSLGIISINSQQGQFKSLLKLGNTNRAYSLYINNAGTEIYLLGANENTITKVNATTNERTDISIPGNLSIDALAIANNGTIWATQFMNGLVRINSDGTASVFSALPTGNRAFFDRNAPETLWLATTYGYSSSVHKVNTDTLTDTLIPTGNNITVLLPDLLGGGAALNSENSITYITTLK